MTPHRYPSPVDSGNNTLLMTYPQRFYFHQLRGCLVIVFQLLPKAARSFSSVAMCYVSVLRLHRRGTL